MNPFSSQFVNPLHGTYIAPDEFRSGSNTNHKLLDILAKQVQETRLLQIVGPHGCGKSTLAYRLAIRSMKKFASVHSVILRPGNRVWTKPEVQWNFQRPFDSFVENDQNKLVIVDGIEAIGWITRQVFIRQLVSQNCNLLLTTHRNLWGIKTLVKLAPSVEHFCSIANELQEEYEKQISDAVLRKAFFDNRGNYRDAFWQLYDVWDKLNKNNEVRA